jgi:hypothetical protein
MSDYYLVEKGVRPYIYATGRNEDGSIRFTVNPREAFIGEGDPPSDKTLERYNLEVIDAEPWRLKGYESEAEYLKTLWGSSYPIS